MIIDYKGPTIGQLPDINYFHNAIHSDQFK